MLEIHELVPVQVQRAKLDQVREGRGQLAFEAVIVQAQEFEAAQCTERRGERTAQLVVAEL